MVLSQDIVRSVSYQSFDNGSYHQDGGGRVGGVGSVCGPGGSICGAESVYSCPGVVAESVYSQQTDRQLYSEQQRNFIYFCNYALSADKYLHKFQDRIHPIQTAILPCFKLNQW